MDAANEKAGRGSEPYAVIGVSHPDGEQHHRQTEEALALFAHELRNPLGVIRMALELLRLGRDDPATCERAEHVLDQQMRRMSRLIDGLLDLSRIGRGRVQLVKERVDLAELVNSVIETIRPDFEERGHEFELVLPTDPLFLEADRTRLEEVLSNLLENAAKYTDPGGRIRLSVTTASDGIVLKVRDSGIGIAPGLLPHVFDLFRQGPRALDYSAGGLGIGLALVRQIVELHGGSVSVMSAGPGQGSEFVVQLPQEKGREG